MTNALLVIIVLPILTDAIKGLLYAFPTLERKSQCDAPDEGEYDERNPEGQF